MTKPFADWLVSELQFDAQLANKMGKNKRQLKMLEQSLALHMTYYYEMLDEVTLKTRRDIQTALADALEAVGRKDAANAPVENA